MELMAWLGWITVPKDEKLLATRRKVGMNMFRDLNDIEIQEFRQWARDNYKVNTTIEREIWHPHVVMECELMNEEEQDESNKLT